MTKDGAPCSCGKPREAQAVTHRTEPPPTRAPRLHVSALPRGEEELVLDREKAHYVRDVLRLGAGDSLVLFDGSGWDYPATVALASPRDVRLRVLEPRRGMQEPPVRLSLGVCLLKAQKMDWVVQKTVELGVHEILPLVSRRSVTTLEGERSEKRQERWQKIAQEACRQCGRSRVPEVHPVGALADLLGRGPEADLRLLFTAEGAVPLDSLPDGDGGARPLERIVAVTGPEGGFSREEERLALGAGFVPVGLGPRTLRAETAAILGAGLVQYAFGDLGARGSRGRP